MIIFTGHIRIEPDKVERYEKLMTEFCAKVRENEPGTVYYEGSKHVSEPGKYLVVEIYRDVAGFEDHKAKDYFKVALSEIGPLAAEVSVNRYETFTA